MLTRGSLKAALKVVRRNRARSFLTMLGVIIGVASVIIVVAIGQGVKQQVSRQYDHIGTDLITVRGGQVASQSSVGLGVFSGLRVSDTLGPKDTTAIAQATHGATVVPLSLIAGSVNVNHQSYQNAPVIGTSADLPRILNQSIAYGSFFSSSDDNVAVIGQDEALRLFGTVVPLGESFSFRDATFTVVGVFNEFPEIPLTNDVNFNTAVFIPNSTALQVTGGTALPYEILIKPSQSKQLDRTVAQTKATLLKNHGDAHDFSVLKTSDQLAATNNTLHLLTQLIAGVAAISLFVGGIGIMNITLVSVTERMHEVGIRKAVGATNRQILSEFMAEAVVLSVAGGIFGIIAAGAVDVILRVLTSLQPIIQWQVVVVTTLISVGIGVLFGTAPALKAARKDPIAALRGE
jgi:ABC-type antimicrobial peptide transport system permease subunit